MPCRQAGLPLVLLMSFPEHEGSRLRLGGSAVDRNRPLVMWKAELGSRQPCLIHSQETGRLPDWLAPPRGRMRRAPVAHSQTQSEPPVLQARVELRAQALGPLGTQAAPRQSIAVPC